MNYYDQQNMKSADMIGLTCSLCKPVLMILGIVWIGQQITGAAHTSPLILSPPKAAPTLLDAIIQVESGGNPNAVGDSGKAVGIMQIWPIMVEDINRILNKNVYTLEDRYNPNKSVEMYNIFMEHYCKFYSDEQKARCWNGGPDGWKKTATLPYWNKVKKVLGEIK